MLAGIFGVVRTLGPVNAIGIAVVMLASLTLLPAILALVGRRVFWPRAATVAPGAPEARPDERRVVPDRHRRVGAGRPRGSRARCRSSCSARSGSSPTRSTSTTPGSSAPRPTPPPATSGWPAPSRPAPSIPTTVLVARTDGTITGQDIAAVATRLEEIDGVASVRDSGRRSSDAQVAELLAVFTDNPLRPAAIDRVAELREAAAGIDPSLAVLVGGGSGERYDYRAAGARDLRVVAPLVLLVVFLTLVALCVRSSRRSTWWRRWCSRSWPRSASPMVFVRTVLDRPGVDAVTPADHLHLPRRARLGLQHLPDEPRARGGRRARHARGDAARARRDRAGDHERGPDPRRHVRRPAVLPARTS